MVQTRNESGSRREMGDDERASKRARCRNVRRRERSAEKGQGAKESNDWVTISLVVICRQIRRPDNTANIIMGLAQGPSRYGRAPTDYARQVFVVGLKVDPRRPDVVGRCESEDKSMLDLFKIGVRHCCGKEVLRLSLRFLSLSLAISSSGHNDHGSWALLAA